MNIKVVGLDIAKNVFQVCVWLQDGNVAWNRKVVRSKLLDVIRQFPDGTLIAMEACATSHYWGRTFEAMGYAVKLLPAQHVKPMARRQKNDANDALAICEAAFRPEIHPVSIKTVEQQDIKALRCVRRRKVEQRTAVVNQARALAAEYGIGFPKGVLELLRVLPSALDDDENGLSYVARDLLHNLNDDIKRLNDGIDATSHQISLLCKQQPRYQALLSIPGVGPIVAAALLSEVGDGAQFTNGRQLSAWCGLVPRQSSSGGKTTLYGITKSGNSELRVLLVHGARAVTHWSTKRNDALGEWLKKLIERRGKKKAIVALANKIARIAWCVLSGSSNFDLKLAFHPV